MTSGDEIFINEDGEEIITRKTKRPAVEAKRLFYQGNQQRVLSQVKRLVQEKTTIKGKGTRKKDSSEVEGPVEISDEEDLEAKEELEKQKELKKQRKAIQKEAEEEVMATIKQHQLEMLIQPSVHSTPVDEVEVSEVNLEDARTQAMLQRYYAGKEYRVTVILGMSQLEASQGNKRISLDIYGSQDMEQLFGRVVGEANLSPYTPFTVIHEGQEVVKSATIASLGSHSDHLTLSLYHKDVWERESRGRVDTRAKMVESIQTIAFDHRDFPDPEPEPALPPAAVPQGPPALCLRIKSKEVDEEVEVELDETLQQALQRLNLAGKRLRFDGAYLDLKVPVRQLELEEGDCLELVS